MSHSYKDYKKLVQEIQVKLILKRYGRQASLETRYVHELWAWEAPAGGVCFTHLLQVRLIDSTEKVQASGSRKGKSYENSLTYRQVCAGFSSKTERLLEKRCVHDKCAACSHYWFSHNVKQWVLCVSIVQIFWNLLFVWINSMCCNHHRMLLSELQTQLKWSYSLLGKFTKTAPVICTRSFSLIASNRWYRGKKKKKQSWFYNRCETDECAMLMQHLGKLEPRNKWQQI